MAANYRTHSLIMGRLSKPIKDDDTVIPKGTVVFLCRLATLPCKPFDNHSTKDVYAAVAEVAINGNGVAHAWRLHLEIDSVECVASTTTRYVGEAYGQDVAAACRDEIEAA